MLEKHYKERGDAYKVSIFACLSVYELDFVWNNTGSPSCRCRSCEGSCSSREARSRSGRKAETCQRQSKETEEIATRGSKVVPDFVVEFQYPFDQDRNAVAAAARSVTDSAEKMEREKKKLEEFEASLEREEKILEGIRDSLKGSIHIRFILSRF
jgi:hypothetical protein